MLNLISIFNNLFAKYSYCKRCDMISYNPLWKIMHKKEITTYQLIKRGIDKKTIHNLKNNANITMLTAEKICRILDCQINEIVEFINDTIDENVITTENKHKLKK